MSTNLFLKLWPTWVRQAENRTRFEKIPSCRIWSEFPIWQSISSAPFGKASAHSVKCAVGANLPVNQPRGVCWVIPVASDMSLHVASRCGGGGGSDVTLTVMTLSWPLHAHAPNLGGRTPASQTPSVPTAHSCEPSRAEKLFCRNALTANKYLPDARGSWK